MPAYVRAGALAELNAFVSPANLDLARKGLADPDPMVRIGALDMLEGIQVEGLWPLLSPLLCDSVRGVRLRAVSLLAAVPDIKAAARRIAIASTARQPSLLPRSVSTPIVPKRARRSDRSMPIADKPPKRKPNSPRPCG